MRLLALVALFLLTMSTTVGAASYNYITPQELKSSFEAKTDFLIIDIQEKNSFSKHHLPGSIETNAYPVKSDGDKSKLDMAIKLYHESGKQIVIVCPRGAGGAKRCYNYMKTKDVPDEKMFILKNGIAGWPYKELLVGK